MMDERTPEAPNCETPDQAIVTPEAMEREIVQTLTAVVNASGFKNAWINGADAHEAWGVYYRYGMAYVPGRGLITCLTFANVVFSERLQKRGVMRTVIARLRVTFPDLPIVCEQVHNGPLAQTLLRHGFVRIDDGWTSTPTLALMPDQAEAKERLAASFVLSRTS